MREHSCSISASPGKRERSPPPTHSLSSSFHTLSERGSSFVTSSAISFFCYDVMRKEANRTVSRLSFCRERSLMMSVFGRLVSDGGYFCNMRFIRSRDSVEKDRWNCATLRPFEEMGIHRDRRPIAAGMQRTPKPARSHRWDSPRIDATLIAAYSSESIEKQSAPSPQALFRFSIVSSTMRVEGRIKIGDLIGYVDALEERFSFP